MQDESAGSLDEAAKVASISTAAPLDTVGCAQQWVQEHLATTRTEEPSSRRQGERQDVLCALGERLATLARLLQGKNLTVDCSQRTKLLMKRLVSLKSQPSERRRKRFWREPKPKRQELDVVGAWQIASELDCLLVELGDGGYVRVCVEQELRRIENTDSPSWLLPADVQLLESLRAELQDADERSGAPPTAEMVESARQRTVEMLIPIYQARSRWQAEQFRLELLRKARLQWVQWVLVTLLVSAVVVLIAAFRYAAGGASLPAIALQIGLAVIMGMLGAVLAGVRRLREAPLRANELSNYKAALGAQLFVGGALALIAFNLLELGVLPSFDMDGSSTYGELAQLAVYGMLAGFSEPFVIGILQSLMQSRRPVENAPASRPSAAPDPGTSRNCSPV